MAKEEELIREHYSARLQKWIDEYERPTSYPFTRIRLARVIHYLTEQHIAPRNILDVGCGVGIPSMEIAQLSNASIYGFDLSPELIEYANTRSRQLGLSAEYRVGSATDPSAYPDRPFDLIMAFGVFQHIPDDVTVFNYLRQRLAPNGLLVVSLRNPLFGLVTFNRPSYELFCELFQEFLQSESGPVLDNFLKSKFDLALPPARSGGGNDLQLDDLIYKYHNPLTISEVLTQAQLASVHMDFYRHHATPPLLESQAGAQFQALSLERDATANDWRSMFLCSTYILYCCHAS